MEYVSFRLGKEVYALDVWHAREIVDTPQISQMPNAPEWIHGLMNLRGRILPVVDLKKKFGLDGAGGDGSSGRGYVIVVELTAEDGEPLGVGVLADAVLEVFEVEKADLAPPPKFGARFSRAYLLGMVKRDSTIVAIMDAAKVLADTDVTIPAEEEPGREAPPQTDDASHGSLSCDSHAT